MRYYVFPLWIIFSALFACESPSTQRSAQAEPEETAVEVVNFKADDLSESAGQLTLDDIPAQGSSPNTVFFSGTYVLPEAGGLSFEVDLVQKDDSITGSYCGYTETRHDCGMPSQGAPDCQIKGVIRNNIAYLIFRSCYMDKEGKAQLTANDRDLIWNTTMYPQNEGGINFCAAPDSSLLINTAPEFALPLRLPAFEAKSPHLILDLPKADTHYVFSGTNVLHSLTDPDAYKTRLQPGTPFRIVEEEGSYAYAQIGDEVFEVPGYRIAFQQEGKTDTGYIHLESIALHRFQDNHGNLFLLGLEGEEDLIWKVRDHTRRWRTFSTGLRQLLEMKHGYFPVFSYHIQTIPAVYLDGFTFFKIDLLHKDRGNEYAHSSIFSWNGQELAPILALKPGVLYQNPQLRIMHNQLEISIQTVKTAYQDSFYQEARQYHYFSVSHHQLAPEKPDSRTRIALAYLGQNSEFTFPDSLESLTWKGVRQENSRLIFEPVELDITKKQAENEIIGKWTKKNLVSRSGDKYDFIVSGLSNHSDIIPRKSGSFSEGDFHPGKEKRLWFPGTDWRFTALGNNNQYGGSEKFTLLLTGIRDGKLIEQPIHFSSLREMPVEFLWAGDLDGDQLPDFIMNVDEKGLSSDNRLFLSSLGGEGKLVGFGGFFYSEMPGC